MDPCANSDFEYYLLSRDEVSFDLEGGAQRIALQFGDKYSDFFGVASLCGDPTLAAYEQTDFQGTKHSEILVDVLDVAADEFLIEFPPSGYTFDSPYNSIYFHISKFNLTVFYTHKNYTDVYAISKNVSLENPCLNVQSYFNIDANPISNYTQGQASTSYTLSVGDDVSDRFGVPGSCGSYLFVEHDIGDILTVTAINRTAFTVTVGDPELTFSDTANKLIVFRIKLLLTGDSDEVPDTEWTYED